MTEATKRIIIPLDGISRQEALKLAAELQGLVWGFKVNDLLVEHGIAIVKELKPFGGVFADAKLHDIPNTVANGAQRLAGAGADLITIHASGGAKMIEMAVKAAAPAGVLAVTVLTSLAEQDAVAIFGKAPHEAVPALARMAKANGACGVVCSPKELSIIGTLPELAGLLKVIPGIRPSWYGAADDQARVESPRVAVESGADLLVIGRPITQHPNPREAAQMVIDEIS
jgi:orotidine-5'-phosphate decarboxylase